MKKLTAIILLVITMASCTTKEENNPFFSEYNTPFGVPPFDQIQNEHFMPAFDEGIRQQEERIAEIIANPEAPTFENTIAAFDYSGKLIGQVGAVFYNFISSNTTDEIQAIAQELSPKMSAHMDNISLNLELFERVKAVYEQRDQLDLDEEQAMLLKVTYENFVRNGAALPAEKQERFREINKDLGLLTLKFSQNVLNDVNTWKMFVENEADLAGLPQPVIDAAAEAAAKEGKEGQWLFTLQNPSVMPFLSYAENRELREKINRAYINRGNMGNENDNKVNINEILRLRIERSQMLGFENFAAFNLDNRMAKNQETVNSFLNELWSKALPIAQDEAVLFAKSNKGRWT
jgi:peptidyl-dipeptidase Dcp